VPSPNCLRVYRLDQLLRSPFFLLLTSALTEIGLHPKHAPKRNRLYQEATIAKLALGLHLSSVRPGLGACGFEETLDEKPAHYSMDGS
jgi:hypothetical protein